MTEPHKALKSPPKAKASSASSPEYNRDGIPKTLDLSCAQKWAASRVSERRFNHVEGVAAIAADLAREGNCDPFIAELAGWLHDGCKEIKDKQLVQMAKEFAIQLHPIEESNGHLLHGPVAASVVKSEFGVTHQDLLDAISQHTLGAVPMSTLSKILFLSDCLEASRPPEFTDPIWQALGYGKQQKHRSLRTLKRELNLDAGMLVACNLSLRYLIDDQKIIHPRTIEVRNHFLQLQRERNT